MSEKKERFEFPVRKNWNKTTKEEKAEVVDIVPEPQVSPALLTVITAKSLEAVKDQRRMLMDFIRSQLIKNTDYGIVPGTKYPSLYKPGAEKLAKLFRLGKRIVEKEREIDVKGNFAFFSYTVEIYQLDSGVAVAQLEGSANSQEKKYRERQIYDKQTRKPTGTEVVPIGDLLNTLQKMAQKRAFVGAVIEAVGASDFYTQDIDSPEDAEALGIRTVAPTAIETNVTIPKVTSASSQQETGAPMCCGKEMRVSKYCKDPTEDYYWCGECKAKAGK